MVKFRRFVGIIMSLLFGIVLMTGCLFSMDEEVQSLFYNDEAQITAEIQMTRGDLKVIKGTDQLVKVISHTSNDKYIPILSDTGNHVIIAHSDKVDTILSGKCEWDVYLNEAVTMDLQVVLGVGNAVLDLADLELSNLEVVVGAGSLELDLSEIVPGDLTVFLSNAAGSISLKVPSEIGVRIKITGIGAHNFKDFTKDGDYYVNSAFATASAFMDIEIKVGAGNVVVE